MDVSRWSVIVQTLFIFLISCFGLIYFFYRQNYKYWKKRGVPYEKPFLFFGNISFLMRSSFWDYFNRIGKKYKKDYIGLFLAWKPVLVIQSPEIAKQILQKDVKYFQNRYCYSSYSSDPLGSLNLFTVKNPMWNHLRHELSPMFTSARLRTLTELMNINSRQLVAKIKNDYVDKKLPVNLKELFSMYTSDTVAYSVFGLRMSVLSDKSSPLWFITNHMVKWTFWRGFEFTMIFFIPVLAKLFRLKFFSQPATQYVKQLFWNVVEERQKTGKSSDLDLVNHLLKMKENLHIPVDDPKLADELMLAQAAVFILGSIETSSTTLTYCLLELAHHPEEQQKLYEEIDEALKKHNKEILEYNELLELKYLTACINETLRKYPPVPYIDRECIKTYKVDDNLTIDKSIPVFVNIIAIHHNDEYYPEPHKWRPERMINTTENDNLQFRFLPFGEGPRFCIGKRYGMMQIRTAIAQMIHKYRFEPTLEEPYEVDSDPYSVILAPKTGGTVKFVLR